MSLSGLWLVMLSLGLVTNVLLLLSGASAVLDDPFQGGMTKETQILIRMGFSLVLFVINAYIFMGANEMRTSGNLQMARNACMLACIPCLGPCYLLGIPVGLWGSSVLARPEVVNSFER